MTIDEKKTIIAGRLKDPMKKKRTIFALCCSRDNNVKQSAQKEKNPRDNTLPFDD